MDAPARPVGVLVDVIGIEGAERLIAFAGCGLAGHDDSLSPPSLAVKSAAFTMTVSDRERLPAR
jgi:hypothetical protein